MVAYPIPKVDGKHAGDTLTHFIRDFGEPEQLTFDGASVQRVRKRDLWMR